MPSSSDGRHNAARSALAAGGPTIMIAHLVLREMAIMITQIIYHSHAVGILPEAIIAVIESAVSAQCRQLLMPPAPPCPRNRQIALIIIYTSGCCSALRETAESSRNILKTQGAIASGQKHARRRQGVAHVEALNARSNHVVRPHGPFFLLDAISRAASSAILSTGNVLNIVKDDEDGGC